MSPNFARLLPLMILLSGPAAWAAPSTDLAGEYDQVRRIALRDAKVQSAFAKANKVLQEKILDLDPALKGYAEQQRPMSPEEIAPRPRPANAPRPRPANAPRPAPAKVSAPEPAPRKPAIKPFRAAKPEAPKGRTHALAAGETLGSVAARYKVSVADLRRVNRIKDERKLAVGQVLVIPGSKTPAPVF